MAETALDQCMPRPDQVLQMMQGKMGDTLPAWPAQLTDAAAPILADLAAE
jgi:pyruvate carboxylase